MKDMAAKTTALLDASLLSNLTMSAKTTSHQVTSRSSTFHRVRGLKEICGPTATFFSRAPFELKMVRTDTQEFVLTETKRMRDRRTVNNLYYLASSPYFQFGASFRECLLRCEPDRP